MPLASPHTPPAAPDCQVVELRQYTLHPGRRDTLIELFDREFVETQEALGINVIGQFRDLDGPDRFVWLRLGLFDTCPRERAVVRMTPGQGRCWTSLEGGNRGACGAVARSYGDCRGAGARRCQPR